MIALLLAAAAAPAFAPPEGRDYAYVVERTTEGAVPRRFRLQRRVRFGHDVEGVTAQVTLERTEQTPADSAAALFARGQAPFLGRTLVAHFARDGEVRSIDGADAAFTAVTRTLDPRAAAPLAALTPAWRFAILASIVAPLVAGADALAQPGAGRVTLTSALPGGGPVRIEGTRTVTRDRVGRLVFVTQAQGAGIAIERTRIVDPVTGLVLEERETRTITGDGARETSRSFTTLTPAVSEYPSAKPRSR